MKKKNDLKCSFCNVYTRMSLFMDMVEWTCWWGVGRLPLSIKVVLTVLFFSFFVCEKVPIFFNLWVSYFSEQPYYWLPCNNYMFMYFIGLLWFYHRYANRPVMSVPGLYDPTEVMNASVMSRCQKEGWIKLAFFLLCFFYYLYR